MTPPKIDTNYNIPPAEASLLLAALHMSAAERLETIRRLTPDDPVKLLSEFIGMAASVMENVHSFAETMIVCESGHDPHYVERWNFPTLTGALIGARIAHGVKQDGLCEGCAFRLGTHANQSGSTTSDADVCARHGEDDFWCHLDMDEKGNPTKKCVGWARARVVHTKHGSGS